MNLKFTVQIWDKGPWYVARCPELDFVSQGSSPEEARHNLGVIV